MDTKEGASMSVDSVSFSFLTDEEIRKQSFVKVTEEMLFNEMHRPISGGLYDLRLGSLNENNTCQTCGPLLHRKCTGHCGHIDLISPVYNPVLFNFLHKLLQRTCFFCKKFRAVSGQVAGKFVSQLELIGKGDIVGAKRLDSLSKDSEGVHESCPTVHSDSQGHNAQPLKPEDWTALQFAEAMSVLNSFLNLKSKKCIHCKAESPNISKPTFGWFYSRGLSNEAMRSNVITSEGLAPDESEGMTSAEDSSAPSGEKRRPTKRRENKRENVPSGIQKQKNYTSFIPTEVKHLLECLWQEEARLCSFISDIQQQRFGKKEGGPSMFFLETILVPPIKFRPPTKGGDSVMEHPQTILLTKVLHCNISLRNALTEKDNSKIDRRWLGLQQSINVLFDGKNTTGQKDAASSGIVQILEKKEGLFRQKMMGKRVNYACRSVISPDPYLAVNEIGIPPCFAIKLTYPERVTPWNAAKLRTSVINGPDCHPGATKYVDKLYSNILPQSRKTRISISRKLSSSSGAIMQPGKTPDCEEDGKIVYRHLQDGDVVLVNRQPTLHKPSIMAHVVRVLKGEKTLRMHYANCSTYNADFDGDEMNVHFPQDEVARAEAYNIVNANNQYVRPSNGEPLRSLIQDHIVSAALLTKKDTFLSRNEVEQLLYCSGVTVGSATTFSGKSGKKVLVSCSEDDISAIPPVILKPVHRWSGKQVITALLNHITRGQPPFSVEKGGKLPYDFFKSRINKGEHVHEETDEDKFSKRIKSNQTVTTRKKYLSDDKMLIRGNDLLCGVIDKAQFAEYGLVHTVQELYGSNTAGFLLSVMSRLFTAYLQMHGFTCGLDDLLITESKDDQRKKQLESCEKSGELIHRNFIGIKDENIKIDPIELQMNIEKTIRSDGESALTYLDRQMTNELNSKTSTGVINELLSEGLLKPSGRNCISLMTTSGAKGSKVNFQQISSFLGQQELEGKRVPRMISGKTLPCFHPWDWVARAGGYIIDRFLTGLRPQEYYFHCMAGREGLVDTAVKTSRSGYLQRCLIKNLECLKISYDHTVRDGDGSIVQFCYGEDGVDVHQISFIEKFDALTLNREILKRKSGHELGVFNSYISEVPVALMEKAEKFLKDSKMEHKMNDLQELIKQKYIKSLAQPGEPVGVLAAQSVGEPSTQMTLNTFHLAGRGEMNVTLGIPRLQEILMTASNNIKTPIMTCPLKEGSRKEDAVRLSDKLKKITVADIIESMEVSVMPFSVHHDFICRIYKLKMHLHKPAHYPQYTDISISDWAEILEVHFLRALEDAIQNHVALLSKMSGIKKLVSETRTKMANEVDEDAAGTRSRGEETEDDLDDGEGADDLGSDSRRRIGQTADDVDYEGSEEENEDEGEPSGSESEEMSGDETQISENEISVSPSQLGTPSNKKSKTKMPESPSQAGTKTKSKSTKGEKTKAKKKKSWERIRKDFDRQIYVKSTESNEKLLFEVHFRFTNEPHVLLAEIAQKTAKKVHIQNPGTIEQCRVTDCKENQVIYFGKNPKEKRESCSPERKQNIPALSTSGVDFKAFWKVQDLLDCRYLYSNSIHAMLENYGVEAARETIIREIMHVFGSYGISVNFRHLSLIADYMTHSGGYRPMSRMGGIAESTSPFSKMCFETASNFIVQAALHGEVDNLESPSARIILGLPVKMGTGSFDLMQKLEI